MYQDYLLTIAQISGALLGFVGVVLALGRRSEGVLNKRDESGLFHLIYTSTGALFFSLLMYVLLISFEQQDIIWRVGSAIFALYATYGPVKAMLEGRKGENRLDSLFRRLLEVLSFVLVFFNVLVVFNIIITYAPLVYMLSLIFLFAVSISYFIPLVYFKTRE